MVDGLVQTGSNTSIHVTGCGKIFGYFLITSDYIEQKLINFVRKLCLKFQVCWVLVVVSVSTNGIIVMYSECHQVNIFWQDPGPSHLLHVDVADTKTNISTDSYGH